MIIGERESFVGTKESALIADWTSVVLPEIPATIGFKPRSFPGFIPTQRAP